MKGSVLLDIGPRVAYLDKSDQHHDWAIKRFSRLSSPFFLREAVVSETSFLLADVLQAVAKVGNWLQRGILILSPIGAAAQTAVFELIAFCDEQLVAQADDGALWKCHFCAVAGVAGDAGCGMQNSPQVVENDLIDKRR